MQMYYVVEVITIPLLGYLKRRIGTSFLIIAQKIIIDIIGLECTKSVKENMKEVLFRNFT